ncbi:MAG: MoaD/ThiS family protein [Chloroflexi bacterium]|nr:MoaD/ThiS family protein [Chloroflexota bacterium]
MRLKVASGPDELSVEFPDGRPVTVRELLQAAGEQRSDLYRRWCDPEGRLRSSLPVFVDGEHIRYRQGLDTELTEGNQVYVMPIVTGG